MGACCWPARVVRRRRHISDRWTFGAPAVRPVQQQRGCQNRDRSMLEVLGEPEKLRAVASGDEPRERLSELVRAELPAPPLMTRH